MDYDDLLLGIWAYSIY